MIVQVYGIRTPEMRLLDQLISNYFRVADCFFSCKNVFRIAPYVNIEIKLLNQAFLLRLFHVKCFLQVTAVGKIHSISFYFCFQWDL